MMRRLIVFLLALAIAAAQQPAQDDGSAKFSSSAQLVVEAVTVKDKSGKPVEGLTEKDFTVTEDGVAQTIEGNGNGPIDAFIHALGQNVALVDYHEHAIGSGSNASAVSYIELRLGQERPLHGVGIDPNIITASLKAVLSGLNRIMARSEQAEEAVAS